MGEEGVQKSVLERLEVVQKAVELEQGQQFGLLHHLDENWEDGEEEAHLLMGDHFQLLNVQFRVPDEDRLYFQHHLEVFLILAHLFPTSSRPLSLEA